MVIHRYKTAAYYRISKEDKKRRLESESISSQRAIVRSYIESSDDLDLIEEYIDDGYTGTNFERPAFIRMLEDIKTGKINTVIVKDHSRFGREYIETGNFIEKIFPLQNVRFIAINDDIDTLYENSAMDFLPFKAVYNEMYVKDISRKVRSSLQAKKREGLFLGWQGRFGYKRSEEDKRKLVIDENEATIVREIFSMAAKGLSPRKIAIALTDKGIPTPSEFRKLNKVSKTPGIWCDRTIGEMLNNPVYIGNMTQGIRKRVSYKIKKEVRTPRSEWIIVEGTHEPIIDRITFERVQAILKTKGRKKETTKNYYLLSGFLYCEECGHALSVTKSKDRKQAYTGCTFYKKNSKYGVCTPHTNNYGKLEATVLTEVREICKQYIDKEKLYRIATQHKPSQEKRDKVKVEIQRLKSSIEKKKKNKITIYEDKLEGIIDGDTYLQMLQKVNTALDHEEYLLQQAMSNSEDNDNGIEQDKENLKIAKSLLSMTKPNPFLIYQLIDKITVSQEKKINIFFKIKPL